MHRAAPVIFALAVGCMPAEGAIGIVELDECSDVPLASSIVRLQDATGQPAQADEVVYTVDGLERGPCTAVDEQATVFVCGWSEVGAFEVTIREGSRAQTHPFEVAPLDSCGIERALVDVLVDSGQVLLRYE